MPERPFTPPTRKPVSEFPTPDPSVAFYTELVNRDDPAYMANQPVKRGQLYANMVGAKRDVITTYPNLFFLRERKFQLSDQQVLWDWTTDELAEDTYNSEVTYVANAVTYPAFTRTYTMRRELWEDDPTRVIGSPLPGIVAVEITSPGQNHTSAIGVIEGTTVEIEFTVSATGGLMNGVITNTGNELIQNGTAITIIGDGQDSSAIAVTQPIGCVLTAQKKEELPDADPQSHELVKVTRVYETLPGPWIYTTKIDKDGMFVTTKTRRQVADFITDKDEILNGEWIQTWHKDADDFVSEETIETRPVPGNPIINTKVAEDGKILTTTKTLVDTTTLVSSETLVGGVWTKNYGQEVDDSTLIKVHQASNKVSWQISDARPVPGNPMVDTRVEEDGKITTITKTLKDTTLIVSQEVISGGNWIRTHKEEVSDLVANEVVESRPIPGNPLVDTKVEEDGMTLTTTKFLRDTSLIVTSEVISGGNWIRHFKQEVSDLVAWDTTESRPVPGNPIVDDAIDKDGKILATVRTLKDFTTISPSEQILLGNWVKIEAKSISDLVAWEVVTARGVPGNEILSSGISSDLHVENIHTELRDQSTITPDSSESGGFITTIEKKDVSDLVANQVRTVTKWLDTSSYSISIVNLIPREFMAFIPTFTESHVLAGIASMPSLAIGEFEHSQRQLNKLLYEDRITSLGPISLPITHTNQETTEEYGGGVLNVNLTLDVLGAQTIDQGLLVVNSTLTDLGNGMVVKETRVLPDVSWQLLYGTEVDPRTGIVIGVQRQVIAAGTTGGVSVNGYTDIKALDKWRSIQITSKLDITTLPAPLTWETTAGYTFENTLDSATFLWAAVSGPCCYAFDAALELEITQGYVGPCRAKITESYTNGPPVDAVSITQFFPQGYTIGYAWAVGSSDPDTCNLCKANARTWPIPPTLHDAITISGGVILVNGTYTSTLPATNPIALPAPGTLITKEVNVEQWRFGVFFKRITEIYVPG